MSTRYIIDNGYVTKQRRDQVEQRWEDMYEVAFSTHEYELFGSAIRKLEERQREDEKQKRIRELKEELRRLEGE